MKRELANGLMMVVLLAGCATQKVKTPMAETAPAPEAAMPAPEPPPPVESFRAKAPAAAPTRPFNSPLGPPVEVLDIEGKPVTR